MNILPKARTENLVEQNLGTEILIYDLNIHKAFNLNETSSIVYKACDGKASFDELKRQYKFTDDFIFLALDELKKNNLLANNTSYQSPFSGTNRREVIKRVGLATMFALPLITGLIAPTAAQAASGTNGEPVFANLLETCSEPEHKCALFGYEFCADTLTSGMRCCKRAESGQAMPGESFGLGFGDYVYHYARIGTTTATCQQIAGGGKCCDGRTAYGTCKLGELTSDYGNGFGEYLVDSCDCTCP
jgi:hypothetical protein